VTASPATWAATIKDHVILNDDPATRELLAIVEDDLHANGRHFRTLDTATR
jgi:hypothetical protein